LLIGIFIHAETPLRGGSRRPERPLYASGADVRLWLVILVSACDRGGPADIRHIAGLAIREMNVRADANIGTCPPSEPGSGEAERH
jgi:hypothetical protein